MAKRKDNWRTYHSSSGIYIYRKPSKDDALNECIRVSFFREYAAPDSESNERFEWLSPTEAAYLTHDLMRYITGSLEYQGLHYGDTFSTVEINEDEEYCPVSWVWLYRMYIKDNFIADDGLLRMSFVHHPDDPRKEAVIDRSIAKGVVSALLDALEDIRSGA